MCGRYTLTVTLDELIIRYHIDKPTNRFHRPKYNVAPTQQVIAIINDGANNRLGELKWGLVPSWAKDEKIGSKMINARSETILEKASFKKLIDSKRCIIPADGFYEWKKSGGSKQPMRIVMKDLDIFSMAALYDTWINPDGDKVNTCTILTTAPNRLMQSIHDRMPVILRPEEERLWLDRNHRDISRLIELLKPYTADEMKAYPVSPLVGNVNNDKEECIQEVFNLV
jgi:putative SOS response-associated peptidase YedK